MSNRLTPTYFWNVVVNYTVFVFLNNVISGGTELWRNRLPFYSVYGVRWDEEQETQA